LYFNEKNIFDALIFAASQQKVTSEIGKIEKWRELEQNQKSG